MVDDPLAPLRAALREPDQQVWHRRLRARWSPPPAEPQRPPLLDSLAGVAADPQQEIAGGQPWPRFDGSPDGSAPDAAGGWRLPLAGGPGGPSPQAAGGRWWLPLVAVPVLALAVVVVTALRGGAPPAADAPADMATPSSSPSTTEHPDGEAAVRLWPAEAIEVAGREVRRGGDRWEVGAEGDVVAVGDWDCDHLPTPAVLRPSTGTVAVFDTWDGTVPARPVTTIAGAAALRPGTTCGEASVTTADGVDRPLDTRPGAGR